MNNHMESIDDKQVTPRLPDIVSKLHDILEPLGAPIRARAIRSVLAMFEDDPVGHEQTTTTLLGTAPPRDTPRTNSKFAFGKRAQAWLKKNSLTDEMLEQVYHLENGGKPELFANIPGASKREQTLNAYMLTAALAFLSTDELRFADADAVALCKKEGCHDVAIHAQTRSSLSNRVSGSKESGYVLTAPGQDAAAALIKSIAAPPETK